MIETAGYVVDTLSQKRNGIYYTPSLAAQAMATWAIRLNDDQVLEPCFGSGVFLEAIRQAAAARGFYRVRIRGVELMDAAYRAAIAAGLIEPKDAVSGDFLAVPPFPVDVVIGNPPYVRLRALPKGQCDHALKVTQKVLGVSMDTAGSVWMAFVLHAVDFLNKGGRMASVLPFEFTHVRYAKPLWKFLGSSFGTLRVARVKERLFPDLMQEAIILFADNCGGTTDGVEFEVYDSTRNLLAGVYYAKKRIALSEIVNGGRPFFEGLVVR